MTKGPIQPKHMNPAIALNFIKETISNLVGETDYNTTLMGDVNTFINRYIMQRKITKECQN